MPPSGPRKPAQNNQGARPTANVRNEVFENIFGRPAGGHHLGGGPAPSGPSGSSLPAGYPAYPPPGPVIYNPAQPSFPPSLGYVPPPSQLPPRSVVQGNQHVYQPQPQQDTHGYGAYSRVAPQGYGDGSAYAPHTEDLPNRRASFAPSTYSTTSSASYYSPNPQVSPPVPSNGRLPSGTYPSSRQVERDGGRGDRVVSGGSRLQPPPMNLTPAQAYQASEGYGSEVPSPASVVFPHRAGSLAPQLQHASTSRSSLSKSSSRETASASTPSLPSTLTSTTTSYQSKNAEESIVSPPPDYFRAMGSLSIDGPTGGLLNDVVGIPRGDLGLTDRWSSPGAEEDRKISSTSTVKAGPRRSEGTLSSHRRMPSDSSIASSGYTAGPARYMTPLSQIDASPTPAVDSPHSSPTTPTGSEYNLASSIYRRLSRKSMESTNSLPLTSGQESPLPPGAASTSESRAMSFSGSSTARKEGASTVRSGSVGHQHHRPGLSGPPSSYNFPSPLTSQRSLAGTLGNEASSARLAALKTMPHVYPALLSKVAEAFKQLVILSELVKDGITYKDSFDGRTAVEIIADIIKTPDRNLALLLGRALDAQKFFHDVTYDHRLRDTSNEIYQFKERLATPFISDGNGAVESPTSGLGVGVGKAPRPPAQTYPSDSGSIQTSDSHLSLSTPATSTTSHAPRLITMHNPSTPQIAEEGDLDGEDDLPVGVFTLLTDCYSPTCSKEALCYSINCPRRLEQMKRLNMKPQPGLTRKLSEESLGEVKETGTLWIHSVSQEILDSVDDNEKRRQEAINEVMYTERDFVRDLEYLRDSWAKPLRTQEIVAANRRDDFVRQVFWNVHEILAVNHVLGEKLTKRQKQQPVVSAVGDLFLERVPLFEPFVTYGAHQLFGKYEFEKEKAANPAFQKFVDETERKPESRKLELNGYLTKPTTRLGRYPLLLDAVLKYTPDGHPDKKDLPEAIKMIKALLTRVNIETGKSENIFELAQLEQQLVFRPNESIDLRLRDKNRELVYKGPLKRRGGNQGENADLMAFLFDHAFLLVKPKWINKAEQYKVYRRPIPLELLTLIMPEDHYNSAKLSATRNKLMSRPSGSRTAALSHVPPKPESKHGFLMTIVHLGRKGYSMQLWVDTYVSRKKWSEHIDKQQQILRDRSCVFVSETITEGYFGGLRKVNCISPYDTGRRMIYGTDEGVYFSNLRDEKLREPVKVINLLDVTQVDVIEEFQLLIVLSERSVTTFPLDCLDPNDPNAALKRGKRISSHTSFFKSGTCLGKTLVCVVKSSTLSSTIKVLEPIDQSQRGKKPQTSFMKRLNGGNDTLKVFKEFYIPTESSSVHFLKTKLCVGCTKGFEIVDLETLDMQGLLDPSDPSLDFVLKRDNVRPVAIYRIEGDFLLCYDEFAFYVNKNGWRARPKWAIIWEGAPTAFALQYPYVIAFEPTFVEVHHVETGHLVQIIPGNNISCLFADTPPSTINAPAPPPVRQLMYPPSGPGQSGNYRPPFPPPGPGYPQQPMGRPPPHPQMGYGMHPPPPPLARITHRQQVIFVAEEGHVQFLKFPPPSHPPSLHAPRPSK
ncbi:RHO1 GDP-GTP exchange protein 1/2, partial [Tremellales sp. Uapishka_1]